MLHTLGQGCKYQADSRAELVAKMTAAVRVSGRCLKLPFCLEVPTWPHGDRVPSLTSTDRSRAAQRGGGRRWATLSVLCVTLLLISLDNTILNVALPSIVRSIRWPLAVRLTTCRRRSRASRSRKTKPCFCRPSKKATPNWKSW